MFKVLTTIVMLMAVATNNTGLVTERTEVTDPINGTKTVYVDGEFEANYTYNSQTNEWVLEEN